MGFSLICWMERTLPTPANKPLAQPHPYSSPSLGHSVFTLTLAQQELSGRGIISWDPWLWNHLGQPLVPSPLRAALFPASKDFSFLGFLPVVFTPPKEQSGPECKLPPSTPGQPLYHLVSVAFSLGPVVSAQGTHSENKSRASQLQGRTHRLLTNVSADKPLHLLCLGFRNSKQLALLI